MYLDIIIIILYFIVVFEHMYKKKEGKQWYKRKTSQTDRIRETIYTTKMYAYNYCTYY